MARQKNDAPDSAEATGPTSAQETYEQPAKDKVGRDLGPFESPNTPLPSDSVTTDTRFVDGTETVLMRGDAPDTE